jgi:hypothetical protein
MDTDFLIRKLEDGKIMFNGIILRDGQSIVWSSDGKHEIFDEPQYPLDSPVVDLQFHSRDPVLSPGNPPIVTLKAKKLSRKEREAAKDALMNGRRRSSSVALSGGAITHALAEFTPSPETNVKAIIRNIVRQKTNCPIEEEELFKATVAIIKEQLE